MRAFVRVIDTGSFSQASNQLAIPRSTISKLVADLEAHLGTRLLHRSTRSVAATADGLRYHTQASAMLADIDALDHAMRGQEHKPHGHLRIDAPATFTTQLLIPALPDFQRQYPDITVALGISDRPVNIVGEGVDCVIRAGDVSGDAAMVGRRLVELDYVTCASPGYLARRGRPATPADLAHHDCLGYFFAATTRPNPMVFTRRDERIEVGTSHYSTNDGNGVLAMLRAGMGIGQHFRRVVQAAIDAGELVPVLEDWGQPSMPFHILYPQNRQRNARLTVFVDWLIETFRA